MGWLVTTESGPHSVVGFPSNMVAWAKISLLHVFLAFQLHTVSMAMAGLGAVTANQTADNAIKAFIIIAYLLFLVTFVLAALVHFGGLENSFPVAVASVVMVLLAVVCSIIGVGVFGGDGGRAAYPLTTYVTGALCGLIGGILMCLQLTGHAK